MDLECVVCACVRREKDVKRTAGSLVDKKRELSEEGRTSSRPRRPRDRAGSRNNSDVDDKDRVPGRERRPASKETSSTSKKMKKEKKVKSRTETPSDHHIPTLGGEPSSRRSSLSLSFVATPLI